MKVEDAVLTGFSFLKNRSPIRTGNLRHNAIKLSQDANGYAITVHDGSEGTERIAHYMKYTNENWDNFHYPLYGKKNPNEGWWDRAAVDLVYLLAEELGGKVEVVDD